MKAYRTLRNGPVPIIYDPFDGISKGENDERNYNG